MRRREATDIAKLTGSSGQRNEGSRRKPRKRPEISKFRCTAAADRHVQIEISARRGGWSIGQQELEDANHALVLADAHSEDDAAPIGLPAIVRRKRENMRDLLWVANCVP